MDQIGGVTMTVPEDYTGDPILYLSREVTITLNGELNREIYSKP